MVGLRELKLYYLISDVSQRSNHDKNCFLIDQNIERGTWLPGVGKLIADLLVRCLFVFSLFLKEPETHPELCQGKKRTLQKKKKELQIIIGYSSACNVVMNIKIPVLKLHVHKCLRKHQRHTH